jgi:hypothetical protein
MKKVNRHVPDVPQLVADRGTEIIERHFNAYGVKRACDLPEEGKVRLHRDLQQFFAAELPDGPEPPPSNPWWARAVDRIRGFFTGE